MGRGFVYSGYFGEFDRARLYADSNDEAEEMKSKSMEPIQPSADAVRLVRPAAAELLVRRDDTVARGETARALHELTSLSEAMGLYG